MIKLRAALAFSMGVHAVFLWCGQMASAPKPTDDSASRHKLSVRVVTASVAVEPAIARPKAAESGPSRGQPEDRGDIAADDSGGSRFPVRESGVSQAAQGVPATTDATELPSERNGRAGEEFMAQVSASTTGGGGGSDAATPASQVTVVANAEGEPAADQNDVRWYRLRVASLAAAFKEYPRMARESGLEGVVAVRLLLAPDRRFPEVSLARSSGVRVLDDAALAMIERAAGTVDLPPGLRGRLLSVELPVDYRLD